MKRGSENGGRQGGRRAALAHHATASVHRGVSLSPPFLSGQQENMGLLKATGRLRRAPGSAGSTGLRAGRGTEGVCACEGCSISQGTQDVLIGLSALKSFKYSMNSHIHIGMHAYVLYGCVWRYTRVHTPTHTCAHTPTHTQRQ